MIEALWIGGFFMAFSAFAGKAGMGAAAICYDATIPAHKRVLAICVALLGYVTLFWGLQVLATYFRLLNYLGHLSRALQCGMIVHCAMATGLVLWGIHLLVGAGQQQQRENSAGPGTAHRTIPFGTLLLVLPCPVCIAVILITLSVAYDLLSFHPTTTTAVALGSFATVFLLAMLALFPFRRRITEAGPSFLGFLMVLVGMYFFLIILIAPVYQEALDVYSLAARAPESSGTDHFSLFIVLACAACLFAAGFLRQAKMHTAAIKKRKE